MICRNVSSGQKVFAFHQNYNFCEPGIGRDTSIELEVLLTSVTSSLSRRVRTQTLPALRSIPETGIRNAELR